MLKSLCERKIKELEQNPTLGQDPQMHKAYDYYVNTLNDWTIKQIKGFQTRIKTQPIFEFGEPNIEIHSKSTE